MMISYRSVKKIERLASVPLLAAMILTFLSVFADIGGSYTALYQDVQMQSGPESTGPKPDSSLGSEHILKLSWVSFGFAGQTIRGGSGNDFSRTPERAGYYTARFSGYPGRELTGQRSEANCCNLLAGAQILVMRIARLKAG